MPCRCVCTCGFKTKRRTEIRRPKKEIFWTEEVMISAVKALIAEGINLRYTAFLKSDSELIRRALGQATGRGINARTLYNHSRRLNLVWRDLVEKAGLHRPETIMKRRNFWTKELIIESIQELHTVGCALNTKDIRWNFAKKNAEVLRKVTGEITTGHGLYKTGIKLFGSWNNCLSAAGLNPKSVWFVRPKRAKARYAHLPIQYEDVEVGGVIRKVGFLGFSSPTPEEQMIVSSQFRRIESFMAQVSLEDRAIVESIFSSLLEDSDVDDLEKTIKQACSGKNRNRAKMLFQSLREYLS